MKTNKAYRNKFLIFLVTLISILTVTVSLFNINNYTNFSGVPKATDQEYSLIFSSTKNILNDSSSWGSGKNYAATNLNNKIEFEYSNISHITRGSKNWQSINGGYIRNVDPINGIASIKIITINEDAQIDLYYGWDSILDSTKISLSASNYLINYDFNLLKPSYIKIVAGSTCNISNFEIMFSCKRENICSLSEFKENFNYDTTYDGDGLIIVKYIGIATVVNIPPFVLDNDKIFTVETIRGYAFSGCTSLTSITIPNSVTWIGGYAFSGCTSLTSITIPNSVTRIGEYAFSGCTSLTSITIPNSVTSIGSGVFSYCKSLTSINIPDSVTSIGNKAFSDCTSLTSIIIPNSVTSIGNYVFSYCKSLTSITIPNSVTYIKERAFSGCTSLTSITIPNSVTRIGEYAFSGCTSLTSITIPNSVTSIGNEAFSGCTSLTSITIPNSVTSIGNEAFSGCTSLTSINIPDSVTSIGSGVFSYCTSLTSITIPNSVTSIGNEAFSGCTSLTSITIPNSVTSIGNYVFPTSLKAIFIPSSVLFIESFAFANGTKIYTNFASWPDGWHIRYSSYNYEVIFNVTEIDRNVEGCTIRINNDECTIIEYFGNASSLTIPSMIDGKNVTSIRSGVFANKASLKEIFIPSTVIKIDENAFQNCCSTIIYTDFDSMPKGWYDSLPSDICKIIYGTFGLDVRDNSFLYRQSRSDSYSLVDYKGNNSICEVDGKINNLNVVSVSENVFANHFEIETLIMPDTIETIGNKAFENCSNLYNLVIGSGTKSIALDAFDGCSKIVGCTDGIFYKGSTLEEWNSIENASTIFAGQFIFLYSEEEPETDKGKYWYFDADGTTVHCWDRSF